MKKLLVICFLMIGFAISAMAGISFEVTLSDEVAEEALDGRLVVIITQNSAREPRLQVSVTGVPIWGITMDLWNPGDTVLMADGDPEIYGFPLEQFSDIPAGTYFVQAFFTVYTTFERADGHVLKLAEPGGSGGIQRNFTDPGNIYSAVQEVYLDPESPETIKLVLDNIIKPDYASDEIVQQGVYEDSNSSSL